jgi:enoyl-CoA hydratase/carnithine racemase
MELTAITYEVADHVATITLDRPDALNSFDAAMAREVVWAWETVRDDGDVHVVVLQANGERAFCSGLDLRQDTDWFMRDNEWNSFDPGALLGPKLVHKVWKPVVVACHGMVAGGAQYFLNEADIIICSEDATFFDPHASAGIVSALEPIGMIARGMNVGEVLRWALMGSEERITADTALRIGLVSEVVPGDPAVDLRARARAIAATIAGRNPRAIQGTVRAIWESLDMTRTTALNNGLSYTLIGNVGFDSTPGAKAPVSYR